MYSQLYSSLNNISNNEFESIIVDKKTPVENYLNINIEKTVQLYKEKKNENLYVIEDNNGKEKEVFIKYITLVDFLKYLIGKYKNDDMNIMPGICDTSLNNPENSKYVKYINEHNNYAYVDSLFYYLSGLLNNHYNFPHGIQCYDSFICQKINCKINIADDFEYLCDSNYFNDNMNKLFHFDDKNISEIFNETKKEALNIMEDIDINNLLDDVEPIDINIEDMDNCDNIVTEDVVLDISNNDDCINLENNDSSSDENEEETTDDSSDENETSDDDYEDSDEEDESIDIEVEDDSDDNTVDMENEDSSEDDCDDSDEDDDSDDEELEDDLFLRINKMPTQVVVIENCNNTLDSLLENDLLPPNELESCIFQLLIILYVYQTLFGFTHNDLHTNNVMYIETEEEFLYYTINEKHYKIPTYGKIFKIIDFGRAIYNYNNKLLCSDSFSSNGTAHTQYNFEPFYNAKKPEILPNPSFDLCRLACSLFDFICDDIKNITQYRNNEPIYDLVFSWLYDDNNRNVLYKSNGEDKYPGFKLYKMISKLVHNHIPAKQFSHKCFEKYACETHENNDNIIHIDKLCEEYNKNN